MLKQRLIHPEILAALAEAGHGSRILIADGNYPLGTKVGENAQLVYLNLEPGKLTATEVLSVVAGAVPVESAAVMQPADGSEPPIFAEFSAILDGAELTRFDRFQFYDEASGPDVCLQVATGEQRIYANILLTIGVVMP